MFTNVKVAVVAAALLAAYTDARPAYSALIPNGEAMGKALGHNGDDYTAFGSLFVKDGKSWTAVCKKMWPGSSTTTVGAALGDPCCKWAGAGAPEKVLAKPDPAAAACPAAATPAAATTKPVAQTTPAPVSGATPKVTPAATKADGSSKVTPAPNSADGSSKATPAPTKANGTGKLAPTMPNGELCE